MRAFHINRDVRVKVFTVNLEEGLALRRLWSEGPLLGALRWGGRSVGRDLLWECCSLSSDLLWRCRSLGESRALGNGLH